MKIKLIPLLTSRSLSAAIFGLCCLLLVGALSPAPAQSLGPYDRDNARSVLDSIKDDIRKNYYDPNFRGINLDEHFKHYDAQLKQAQTRDHLTLIMAQALLDFDDSHTFLRPPSRAADIRYGWIMQIIGDGCFVTAVQAKSDAEAKGLKVGDAILAVDGFRPTRENIWKMLYRYYAVAPARSIRLVVQSPGDAQPRQLDVASKIERRTAAIQWEEYGFRDARQGFEEERDRFHEVGADLLIWRMPYFYASEEHIDGIISKARKFKTLIVDLRSNSGGSSKVLERVLGSLFDHDVTVANIKGRKEKDNKPSIAKTRGERSFKGKVIVLVDSDSGSAAEMMARVIQLEKRGAILGDKTAGKVTGAKHFDYQAGNGDLYFYGASITVIDVIMGDGKSLEKVGVTPDELLVPASADLAAGRDPLLSRAASLAGVQLTSEEAGKLFPILRKSFYAGQQ
ncbi:MAG: hypothetical protein H7Y30_10590 [Pyrinomonadaceae bacterium]|nr:hypothetical protein [Pyrinomonadaceae bacterium]